MLLLFYNDGLDNTSTSVAMKEFVLLRTLWVAKVQ